MGATKRNDAVEAGRSGSPVTCAFEDINTPGLYIEHRTGALFRIPDDAVVPGRSPVLEVVARESWTVTRISNDPFLSLTKARMIAADLDLHVNF